MVLYAPIRLEAPMLYRMERRCPATGCVSFLHHTMLPKLSRSPRNRLTPQHSWVCSPRDGRTADIGRHTASDLTYHERFRRWAWIRCRSNRHGPSEDIIVRYGLTRLGRSGQTLCMTWMSWSCCSQAISNCRFSGRRSARRLVKKSLFPLVCATPSTTLALHRIGGVM